jgi:hypothetical protein
MRDGNLLLTDNGISASAFAANALRVNKTPADGIWLQFNITKTGVDADERLDIPIYGKDTDSGWATSDAQVGVVPGQIGAGMAQNQTVVRFAKVQTKFAYIKPRYNTSGTTPGFNVECAVVSGPQRDTAA